MNHNQAGDTIIEVLLAVAVLSSVLAAGYAIMNRNIMLLQNNQERIEASKVAQGQVEALVGMWKDRQSDITAKGSNGFCINSLSAPPDDVTGGSPAADPATDNLTGNYTNCTQGLFHYAIQRTSAATNTYRVYVRWERIGGGLVNQVIFSHRLGD